jgi:hypothetical protein
VRPGRETSTHYFSCSGGPAAVYIKSAQGHVTQNLCFLHLVGSASYIKHSGTSGAQNVDTLFFMLEWAWFGFHKKCLHRPCDIRWDLWVMYCIPVHPGCETSAHYFSCLDGPSGVS